MKQTQTDTNYEHYLSKAISDVSAATEADVNFPQDAIVAKAWLAAKPYGIVWLVGWEKIEYKKIHKTIDAFAKKANAKVEWVGNAYQLTAK